MFNGLGSLYKTDYYAQFFLHDHEKTEREREFGWSAWGIVQFSARSEAGAERKLNRLARNPAKIQAKLPDDYAKYTVELDGDIYTHPFAFEFFSLPYMGKVVL
jgi:hypothetical protein